MSATRKLRSERDVLRGTEYGRLLDEWATSPSRFSGDPRPITELFDLLVEHGRHNGVTKPPRVDGAS